MPQEFIWEVNKMSKEQLVKRFIQEENDINALDQAKKKDGTICDINEQIKAHEESLREQIEAIRKESTDAIEAIRADSAVDELREDKKALLKGYNNEKKRRKAYRDYLYKTMGRAYA